MLLQHMRYGIMAFSLVITVGCSTTPVMLSPEELDQAASTRLATLAEEQVPVTKPITLYEAMARAILYNLDSKVEQMEMNLRIRESQLQRMDMLPQLVVDAGWSDRDSYRGTRSVGISRVNGNEVLGPETLSYSTSSEMDMTYTGISLGWDILDFGLSYVRSQQGADRVLMALENKRALVNRVIEDVRSAYWRAVSAERMLDSIGLLKSRVAQAVEENQKLLDGKRVKPMSVLTTQRDLMSTMAELNELQQELNIAKHQLAALINIDPGTDFDIALPDQHIVEIPAAVDANKMIEIAMRNRPELRELGYQLRINEREASAALLQMLPGIRLHGDYDYESNDYLFNNDWMSWGVKASWNLLEAFRYPVRKKTVEAKEQLLEQRAMALTMAIMTQVHVARTRLAYASHNHENSEQYRSVQHRILEQTRAGFDAGRLSKHTLLREQMNTIIAEIKHDIAVARMQNAFANIYAAVGMDAYAPELKGDETLEDVTVALAEFWKERGDQHITYGNRSGLKAKLQ